MTVGEQHPEIARVRSTAAGFVVLTFQFHKEGHLWVGRCLELGTATDGRSLEKVENELAELVTLHLNALEDVGERQRFFQEHNITLYPSEPPKEVERRVPVTTEPTFTYHRPVQLEEVSTRPGPPTRRELAGV